MARLLGALILSGVVVVGCGNDVGEEWPFGPVACANAFQLDEACIPCAVEHCTQEMDAAYGGSWMTDRTFDGTGSCVGLLSCRCECKLEDSRVESCWACSDYSDRPCLDARDKMRSCMKTKCGGYECQPG